MCVRLYVKICACVCTGVYIYHYVLVCVCMCLHVCNCACKLSICVFSVYLCGSRQRRRGIMNCTFISLCMAPFTYPQGEDDGVELACQCKCLAVVHAACVLLVSKGIKLREQALWHH